MSCVFLNMAQTTPPLPPPLPTPPTVCREDGAEALGEDELPFEFPRGYADPVDLDWEYVGSEPATRVAFYERREPGGEE